MCVLHPSPPLVLLFLSFQCSKNPFSWGPLDCFDINIQKDQRESKAQLVAFPFKAVTFRPCLCYRCLLAGLCQARFDGGFDLCQADLCDQMQSFWLCCMSLLGRSGQWMGLTLLMVQGQLCQFKRNLHMGDPVPAHVVVSRLNSVHGHSHAAQEPKQLSL